MNKIERLSRRYLASLYLDWIIFFIVILVVFESPRLFFQNIDNVDKYIFGIILIIFCMYFLSDFIFINRSLGKRIMSIHIQHVIDNHKISLISIITRRLYEFTWHPLFHRKSFQEKCLEIEHATSTKIVTMKKND